MIEDIEYLSAKLQLHRFSEGEVFQNREVKVVSSWTNQDIPPGGAESVEWSWDKGGSVEPTLYCRIRQRGITRYLVSPL